MRTKTLLLTAALAAAGIATSKAQTTYSVNAVGFVGVTIPHGYEIIANPLVATTNQIQYLISPPAGTALTVYKYQTISHDFSANNYDSDFLQWDDPAQPVSPGEGLFVYNAGPKFTNTFVGEVKQGTMTNTLVTGFNLVSSQVPQTGLLQTQLGYPPSQTGGGDTVYIFNNLSNSYDSYGYDSDFLAWDVEPSLNVGQGFFVLRGAANNWTRTFSVNN